MNNDCKNPDYIGHRSRIKKKFIASLGKELHDYELLEILLFSVFARKDTKKISKKLVERFGNIAGILSADVDQLRDVEDVGESAVVMIKAINEIINRVLKDAIRKRPIFKNWQAILDYAKSNMSNLDHEVFRVLFLSSGLQLIEDELLAVGSNNYVQIDIKNLVKRSLLLNASSIILLHNHPNSAVTASNADIKITNEIIQTLKPLNIKVFDHLIIGNSDIFSFKIEGLL